MWCTQVTGVSQDAVQAYLKLILIVTVWKIRCC